MTARRIGLVETLFLVYWLFVIIIAFHILIYRYIVRASLETNDKRFVPVLAQCFHASSIIELVWKSVSMRRKSPSCMDP